MKINVLGTEYTIMFKNDEEVCAAMNVQVGECGGYCSAAAKEIVIANLNTITDSEAEKDVVKRENIRHEIVHAFFNEYGRVLGQKRGNGGLDCPPGPENLQGVAGGGGAMIATICKGDNVILTPENGYESDMILLALRKCEFLRSINGWSPEEIWNNEPPAE